MLVTDLIKNSNSNIKSTGIVTTEDVKNCSKVIIGFSNEVKRLNIGLKKFLYANLYKHPDVMQMTNQANLVIKDLFLSYMNDIKLLPNDYYQYNLKKINSGFKERVICDYIAGMTDRFAQQEHGKLFNSI